MARRCARCGAESGPDGAFTRWRSVFHPLGRHICFECQSKLKRRDRQAQRFLLPLYPLLGVLLVWLRGNWLVVNVLLVVAFSFLMIVPHEFAHALAAKALGMRVSRIILGHGLTLMEGRLLFPIEVKMLPLGGVAICAHRSRKWLRLKTFLMVLAGPIPSVAVIAVVLTFVPVDELCTNPSGRLMPLAALVAASALNLLVGLLPRKVITPMGKVPSDGLRLLQAPFLSESGVSKELAGYYGLEGWERQRARDYESAIRWYRDGLAKFPDSHALKNDLAVALLRMKRPEEARKLFLELAAESEVEEAVDAIASNNVAASDITIGRPELLEEADRCSAAAYENASWHPNIITTRGAVLVELGKPAEGLGLLREAMEKAHEKHTRASAACYVAIGEHRRGNREEAVRYLEAARKLDPDCLWMEKAEREIGT